LITLIQQRYGNLAVLFYKRAKDEKILEDSNFTDITLDLNCRFTLDYEINLFIQAIFEKILKCISNIKS